MKNGSFPMWVRSLFFQTMPSPCPCPRKVQKKIHEKVKIIFPMKKIKWIFMTLIVLMLLGVAIFYVWIRRPLLPTTKWQAVVEGYAGKTIPCKIYRMLGREMPLVLRIDGQKWFVVYIANSEALVVDPYFIRTTPYLNINARFNPQKGYGLDILHPDYIEKFGEQWHLSCENGMVVFSNTIITVSVSKKGTRP